MAVVFKMNMGDAGKKLDEIDIQFALRSALYWVADTEPSDDVTIAMQDASFEGQWEIVRSAIKEIAEDNTLVSRLHDMPSIPTKT
jgi:hypothetical protein